MEAFRHCNGIWEFGERSDTAIVYVLRTNMTYMYVSVSVCVHNMRYTLNIFIRVITYLFTLNSTVHTEGLNSHFIHYVISHTAYFVYFENIRVIISVGKM